MAFVLTHIVECDHIHTDKKRKGTKCFNDDKTQARSREEANTYFEQMGWKVTYPAEFTGYQHYCPEHKDQH